MIFAVAPHAGAWIEIVAAVCTTWLILSPPTRGRGLKLQLCIQISILTRSPPTRGRGLKLWEMSKEELEEWVAPHAGAWIEISFYRVISDMEQPRRPPRGGVD